MVCRRKCPLACICEIPVMVGEFEHMSDLEYAGVPYQLLVVVSRRYCYLLLVEMCHLQCPVAYMCEIPCMGGEFVLCVGVCSVFLSSNLFVGSVGFCSCIKVSVEDDLGVVDEDSVSIDDCSSGGRGRKALLGSLTADGFDWFLLYI